MGQVPPGNLIVRAQLDRQRVPTLFQDPRLFLDDGMTESIPPRPPPRGPAHLLIMRECNHGYFASFKFQS
jgi:hypothetical protein